ncbi:hypothetical protein FACS1894214_1110 [Planctomycetales bacterium]|nr:hypothetical protein FACS1894214_1110 [Planctomycetales bacterium]
MPLDTFSYYLLVIWLTAFGACIGSFLNVVVYRLPIGKSLSFPPSFCPKCGHPIRWFDNIPVFGWFFLRGRCRDCKEPIALRYPVVEFICAAVFGITACLLFQHKTEITVMLLLTEFTLSAIIATLLGAFLIYRDGNRLPRKLFYPAEILAVIYILMMFW